MRKVANTDMICLLADTARVRDYNRQFDQQTVDALDPGGIHVCSFTLPHSHRAGQPCEPHMRGSWLLKVKGTPDPMVVMLDMDLDEYANLPDEGWVPTMTPHFPTGED